LIISFQSALAADCAYFFYGNGCPHCARAEPTIQQLQQQGVLVQTFEVYQNRTNAMLLQEFFNAKGIPEEEQGVPVLFYSNGYLVGDSPIIERAPAVLSPAGNSPCPTTQQNNATGIVGDFSLSKITQMQPLELLFFVGGAAIVDSINPCAIAVLLILLLADQEPP